MRIHTHRDADNSTATIEVEKAMEKETINPWTWQDQFGFVQANVVTDGKRVVYCAGQTSVNDAGAPVYAGDMPAQLRQAFANLETVLGQSHMALSDVVRLNYYVTDVDAFFAAGETLAGILAHAN